jgi:gliding motility-associated-like protein
MKAFYFVFVLCLLFPAIAWAQVANDECSGAIPLPEVLEFCTGNAGSSNIGATTSFTDANQYDICISEPGQMRDVWYSFVALRDAASITVDGRIAGNERGSLITPQTTLYEGDCSGLTRNEALICKSPFRGINGTNAIITGLTIGETYYIMVGARDGEVGTFELCLNQFEAPPAPSGDCETGVILCDKSPFSVDFLSGSGSVRDNLRADCVASCGPTEANSVWYKWTCDQPGTLAFTVSPRGTAPNEDIDFVVYEYTNGLDNCGSRQTLRCMFSGETNGNTDAQNRPCLGPTGMNLTDTDQTENCGCQAGNNNFVAAIDMVAGRSYGIVIMNFSGSGDGFDITFGGTGTFLGPEPEFTFSSSEVCVGESLTFQDQSTSVDEIVSREWNFGTTATPQFASGAGPHNVVFGEPGTPGVELIITTSRECREVLSQREINVICCQGQFTGSGLATDVVCPADSTGTISFNANSTFSPTTLSYTWSNEATTANLANLRQGSYTLTVSDASGCEAVFDFSVGGPPAFTFDTLITMPSCAGGVDGALQFEVLSGGQGPYEYSFDSRPFSANNRLTDIPVSTINMRARDANDCPIEQDIFVDELQLGLVQGLEVFTEPICAGDANGRIEIQMANGRPNFRYDFGLGDGFQANNVRNGLAAGVYTVMIEDADACTGVFDVTMIEPPAINLVSDNANSTCFGTDDGQITIVSTGGRPAYTYVFNGQPITDTVLTNLVPGTYRIDLTDRNGCVRTLTEVLTEPNEIFPVLEETFDLACFGVPTGGFQLSATGGTPEYTFASDDRVFQADNLLDELPAGVYTLYVMDANGCLDSLSGSLTQPPEFIVDPGPDTRITLGFDTILRAVSNYSPVTYEWLPEGLECINDACSLIRVAPVNTTIYTVVGFNDAGCTDTAMVKVQVIQDLPAFIPNVFSPNGDGVNDGFTIFGGPAIDEVESLRVFHRWGGMVFENENFQPNDPRLGWDGRSGNGQMLNPAVFVFFARVRYLDGAVEEFAGDVTLVK